jgi:glutathione S-transferase
MPTLVTIPFSHFCEKARWALDYARAEYREEGHVPGLHRRAVARVRGKGGSVPVLGLDGDGVLDDSPLIVRWADARATSDRKLLPPGGQELDEALSLEHHLDADLAPHVRRFVYHHLLPDRARTLTLFGNATPRGEHTVARIAFPLLRRFMRSAMRIDEGTATRSRDRVRAVFDEIDARLADGRPYLMGDRFGATDIAFAAFSAPLVHPPEHPYQRVPVDALPPALAAEMGELRERPAGAFALWMYRDRRRAR